MVKIKVLIRWWAILQWGTLGRLEDYLSLCLLVPCERGLNATPISTPSPDSEVYPTGSVLEYDSSQRAGDSVAQPPLVFFREGVREVSIERNS